MLLRAVSLLGMTGREGGQLVILTPISTKQSQNLYRHQPLTKHKEETQQPTAAEQHLSSLDNFNTSLQSLSKTPFSLCLGKSGVKGMASHLSWCLSLVLLRSWLSLLPQPLQDICARFLG